MIKAIFIIAILLPFQNTWTQTQNKVNLQGTSDSVQWINVKTDSGIVHAAVAVPKGDGPFPVIVLLHGTHGFAQEYIQLARDFAAKGFVGIAACWFAGRKGPGERFITPIEFKDAPPFIDVTGTERFRIARNSINSLVQAVATLRYVQKNNIALMGHSRGGGASLDYALTHPGRVQAVILNSTGYPTELANRASDVSTPVLLMHGILDNPNDGGSTFTNIEMARRFESALRAANKDVEVKYYTSSGHNSLFSNPAQSKDAVERVADFLRRRF